jgi:hypothetical protein
MLRKNFPSNKRLRQITALEAVEKRLGDPKRIPERFEKTKTKPTKAQLQKYQIDLKYDAGILKERIAKVV